MGGTLQVSSEPGVGSTFTVLIPLHLRSLAEPGMPAPAQLAGRRLLIVDDNATNRRVLAELVTGWGCTARTCQGPAEALEVLRSAAGAGEAYDVVLVDLNMPDVNGYTLAGMIRADPQVGSTPVVMLTSSAQPGEAQQAERVGISAYLTKPVRSALLRQALHAALGTGQQPAKRPAAVVGSSVLPALIPSQGAAGAGPRSPAEPDELLLVEDNVVNQKVLSAVLTRIGYRVQLAVNGQQALLALEADRFAAVLMDCQMPVMDGYQATAELRRREGTNRHTPVIALTASAMAEDRQRCLGWMTTCPNRSTPRTWQPACRTGCAAKTSRQASRGTPTGSTELNLDVTLHSALTPRPDRRQLHPPRPVTRGQTAGQAQSALAVTAL